MEKCHKCVLRYLEKQKMNDVWWIVFCYLHLALSSLRTPSKYFVIPMKCHKPYFQSAPNNSRLPFFLLLRMCTWKTATKQKKKKEICLFCPLLTKKFLPIFIPWKTTSLCEISQNNFQKPYTQLKELMDNNTLLVTFPRHFLHTNITYLFKNLSNAQLSYCDTDDHEFKRLI